MVHDNKKRLSVEFGAITADNIEQLRKINTASFPIKYNESFYQDVLKRDNTQLNKFAYWNGFVVGAVCARLENFASSASEVAETAAVVATGTNSDHHNRQQQPSNSNSNNTKEGGGGGGDQQQQEHRLYIMTLAVLAAYRGRGIGSQLLQSLLSYCDEQNDKNVVGVREISLHVQISNSDAIHFYTERFDFVQGEMFENYYRRIDPPHCYRLYKPLSKRKGCKKLPGDDVNACLESVTEGLPSSSPKKESTEEPLAQEEANVTTREKAPTAA